MKNWINKNIVPLCALLCLLVLSAAWIGLRLSSNAGTYILKSIEGDSKFIKNIKADMVIEDASHIQNLTLTDGIITHKYQYKMPITSTRPSSLYSGQYFIEHENADVQVSVKKQLGHSDQTHESYQETMERRVDKVRVSILIERKNNTNYHYIDVDSVQVITDLTVQDESHPFVFKMHRDIDIYKPQTTPDGQSITPEPIISPFFETGTEILNEIYVEDTPLYTEDENGTIYFTPALRPYHCGQSAIYRLDEWEDEHIFQEPIVEDGYAYFPMSNSLPMGKATAIAEFPVDGHEFRTVKLDVVDDRLCLLLVVDGTLTLRVYDMDGSLKYESALFQCDMDNISKISTTLYSNKSNGSTMLCYHMIESVSYSSDTAMHTDPKDYLFCIELGKTASLHSVISGHTGLIKAAYIDSHWVLLEAVKSTYQAELHPAYTPTRYFLSALDNQGNTLYLGEIVTDIPEDSIQYYLATGEEWYKQVPVHSLNRSLYCNTIEEDK